MRTPRSACYGGYATMDVRCERCGTVYELDPARLSSGPVTVRCTACKHTFRLLRPDPENAAPKRAWLVRTAAGRLVSFRELTTLQKWIVEGRIGRDDEISKNGETWKRLGNIVELEAFFSVYEKARTFKELVGSAEASEVRGSELLGSIQLTTADLGDAGAPGRSPLPRAASAVQRHSPPRAPTAPPMFGEALMPEVSKPRPEVQSLPTPSPSGPISVIGGTPLASPLPPSLSVSEVPDTMGERASDEDKEEAETHQAPSTALDLVPLMPHPDEAFGSLPPETKDLETDIDVADFDSDEPVEVERSHTPLAEPVVHRPVRSPESKFFQNSQVAPAAFPSTLPPTSAFTKDLDFQFEDAPDRPARPGGRSRGLALIVAGLVMGGVAVGLVIARADDLRQPLTNLQTTIQQWLSPRAEERLALLLKDAEAKADLDTEAGRNEAMQLLEKAHRQDPRSPKVAAEVAFVLARSAMAHRRQALREETEAERINVELDGWRRAVEKAQRARAQLPPRPDLPEPASLRRRAEEARSRAEDELALAKRNIDAARANAPGTLEPERALAAYLLAEGNLDALEPQLARLRASLKKEGRSDAQTDLLEAASHLSGFAAPSNRQREDARALLSSALEERPGLNRARVLLADALAQLGFITDAQEVLQPVLRQAPEHVEAKALAAGLRSRPKTRQLVTTAPSRKPAGAESILRLKPIGEGSSRETRSFDQWLELADRRREAGQVNQALAAYERAAELDADSAEPHTGKGWCFLDLDRPRVALVSFERAVTTNPLFAEAYLGMGETYLRLGDTQAAIEGYRGYIERAPVDDVERKVAERKAAELEAKLAAETASASAP